MSHRRFFKKASILLFHSNMFSFSSMYGFAYSASNTLVINCHWIGFFHHSIPIAGTTSLLWRQLTSACSAQPLGIVYFHWCFPCGWYGVISISPCTCTIYSVAFHTIFGDELIFTLVHAILSYMTSLLQVRNMPDILWSASSGFLLISSYSGHPCLLLSFSFVSIQQVFTPGFLPMPAAQKRQLSFWWQLPYPWWSDYFSGLLQAFDSK